MPAKNKSSKAKSSKAKSSNPKMKKPATKTSGAVKTDPKRVAAILNGLDEAYPNAICELNHENAFQLLIATILSAQCTDARVNQVTATLFKKYPTPEAFAYANPSELERDIRPTGFFGTRPNPSWVRARRLSSGSAGKCLGRWRRCLRFRARHGRRQTLCWVRRTELQAELWWIRTFNAYRTGWI